MCAEYYLPSSSGQINYLEMWKSIPFNHFISESGIQPIFLRHGKMIMFAEDTEDMALIIPGVGKRESAMCPRHYVVDVVVEGFFRVVFEVFCS